MIHSCFIFSIAGWCNKNRIKLKSVLPFVRELPKKIAQILRFSPSKIHTASHEIGVASVLLTPKQRGVPQFGECELL